MSAKQKMLNYLLENVGKIIARDTLAEISGVHDWPRSLRTLRQEGWSLESLPEGYILHSPNKIESAKKREAISAKLRYQVLQRDNSTCQRCGKTIADGIKLEVDHKIPVEWGGETEVDNLWTLCNICNGGKKHFFSDFDADLMREVVKEASGWQKIKRLFELMPNVLIEPSKLEVISGIRDWERTLRAIRQKENMDISWVKPNKDNSQGGYIFKK